jgi:hypothetical protein
MLRCIQCKSKPKLLLLLLLKMRNSYVKMNKEVCNEFGLSWREVVDLIGRVLQRLRNDIVKDVRQKTRRLLIAAVKTVHINEKEDEEPVEKTPKKTGRKSKKKKRDKVDDEVDDEEEEIEEEEVDVDDEVGREKKKEKNETT